jgi:HD-GYP domain-containing protein (c-di-GMP phosphodiesterase class II)
MEVKVPTPQLKVGMFVHALDRSWLDTPCALQGFRIRETEQVTRLSEYCAYVWVDLDRSDPWIISQDLLLQSAAMSRSYGRHEWMSPALREDEALSAMFTDVEQIDPEVRRQQLLEMRRKFQDVKNMSDVVLYTEQTSLRDEVPNAQAAYRQAEGLVSALMRNARQDLGVDIDRAREVVEGMVASVVRNPKAMVWFARLRSRDSYTYNHLIDCAIYLIAFGRHLGFPEETLQALGMGGLMFDIGKARLPDEYLAHAGWLTREQFEQVKRHVEYGLEMLREAGSVSPTAFEAVAQHHERLNRTGYPKAIGGQLIGMFGGMAGIVDVYTALITDRPYARALPALRAIHLLYKERGVGFEAALVEQFIQLVGVYPIGSLVELSSGEVGIVVQENRVRRMQPKLMVILDVDKKRLARPRVVDLILQPTNGAGEPLRIVRELSPGSYGIELREYFR